MKSCSCISLPKSHSTAPTASTENPFPLESTFKDDITVTVSSPKGPKFQTIIEVFQCEFARPGRASRSSSPAHGLQPWKNWSPIHYAAYHGREAALLHFLRGGQSPNGPNRDVEAPLLIAAQAGHLELVKILCAAGADVKATLERNGETALHIALRNGRADIVDSLLSSGPNVDARTTDTWETPLHYAVAKPGSLASVITLLKSGANYEIHDCKGRSAAALAISTLNIHAAVAIINASRGNRRKLSKEKDMLLQHVEKVQNRFSMNNDLIADIFEAGCDPDSTVLVEAIKRNDFSLAEMFLEKGADPNRPTARGLYPILVALNCSDAQMVQLLVKHKVDGTVRDADGLNVLQAALESPSAHDKEAITSILESLLTSGANAKAMYSDGRTLLHHVVGPSLSLSKIALRLIDAGVTVNARDIRGCTALHYAAQSRSCIEVLLKHRANPKLANLDGLTPLLFAVGKANEENEPDLEPLIKVSNLRNVNKEEKTALHVAAERGLEQTVRLLLKYHSETTAIDANTRTPLLLAVLSQQWSLVPLLATQPGMNSWDQSGMTALHYIVTSTPKPTATWKEIASAAAKYCERGVSRSMRDRSGATPLIQAVRTLPEEGLPVIEALLTEKGPSKGNCAGHEDHKQHSALYYAAILEKPKFVLALLKSGAPILLNEWIGRKRPIKPTTPANIQTLKYIADFDWMRRGRSLNRASMTTSQGSVLPKILPLPDLEALLSMGLDSNALPGPPKSNAPRSLLWIVLSQMLKQPPLPDGYLHSVLTMIFASGADLDTMSAPATHSRIRSPSPSPASSRDLTQHPLTFLLEECSDVPLPIITMFLSYNINLAVSSSYYNGRYPLHSAVKASRIDIINLLLSHKADVNAFDAKNHTPLVLAIESSSYEIVELLLTKNAKIDCKDAEGNTLLHVAASRCHPSIISTLLKKGAKASTLSGKKKRPADCMPSVEAMKDREGDRKGVMRLLEDAERMERWELERKQQREEKEKIERERQQRRLEEEARREGKERLRMEKEKRTKTHPPPASVAPISHIITPILSSSEFKSDSNLPASKLDRVGKSPGITLSPRQQAQITQTHIHKPLPQPRVDSGIGQNKALPELNRSKQVFDGPSTRAAQNRTTRDDFGEWLAISKMLDNL